MEHPRLEYELTNTDVPAPVIQAATEHDSAASSYQLTGLHAAFHYLEVHGYNGSYAGPPSDSPANGPRIHRPKQSTISFGSRYDSIETYLEYGTTTLEIVEHLQ